MRPQIKQLHILAGASCVGKSHLVVALKQGLCQELQTCLKLQNPESAQYIDSGYFDKTPLDIDAEEVIIHFDFMHHALVHQTGFKILSRLIKQSEKLTVLTLCSSSKSLTQRHQLRIEKLLKEAKPEQRDQLFFNYHVLYHRYKQSILESPNQLYQYYLKWESYLSSINNVNHYLLDATSSFNWLGSYQSQRVKSIINQKGNT